MGEMNRATSELQCIRVEVFSGGSDGKESLWNAGDQVQSLGWEDPLEKGMATHSSILAWKMPWTEEPGELQSMKSQRIRHDWETNTHRIEGAELITSVSVGKGSSLAAKDGSHIWAGVPFFFVQLGWRNYSGLKKRKDPGSDQICLY